MTKETKEILRVLGAQLAELKGLYQIYDNDPGYSKEKKELRIKIDDIIRQALALAERD